MAHTYQLITAKVGVWMEFSLEITLILASELVLIMERHLSRLKLVLVTTPLEAMPAILIPVLTSRAR